MKRILSFVLVLFVAASLFAATGLTVKAGGAFDLFSLKTAESDGDGAVYTFKGNGLGFDVGVQYDFSDKVMVYADFNMVFPSDYEATVNKSSSWLEKFSDIIKVAEGSAKLLTDGNVTHSLIFLDASVGAAYKFDFNPIKLSVGAGVYYNQLRGAIRLTGKNGTEKVDREEILSFFTIGVSTLVDAKYMVTENIGVCLAAMPQIGIYADRSYNFYENGEKIDYDYQLSGVGISFTMPITIGASYSF